MKVQYALLLDGRYISEPKQTELPDDWKFLDFNFIPEEHLELNADWKLHPRSTFRIEIRRV